MTSWIKLLNKVKYGLSNQRGESLAESVLSFMIFAIFAAAISLTVISSINMSRNAMTNANNQQNAVNEAILENSAMKEISLQLQEKGGNLKVTIPVEQTEQDINSVKVPLSFRPKGSATP